MASTAGEWRQTGAPVTQSEAEWRQLANALPQIIWTCDAQGRLEWVNDRWTELTGLSEAESLDDKGALVAVHPDDREELQRRFARGAGDVESVRDRVPDPHRAAARTAFTSRGSCRCATRTARSRAGWPRPSTCTIAARPRQALRASERRFETVFHLNPQPTAITRASPTAPT